MKQLELTFNPYTKESCIAVSGKPQPKLKDALCGQDGTDLALWVSDFFNLAVEKFNDDIEVIFNGIERDYEYLEDALKKSPHDGLRLTLKTGVISKPEDRLQRLRDLFAKMQEESPFPILNSEDQKQLFTRATDSSFEMAAVATVSAGKSTLINSMLGRELLPARAEATTARVARIHDEKGREGFKAEAYDSSGKLLVTIEPLTLQGMNRLNDMSEALTVNIYGAIPEIESKDVALILTDTPGPNNSQAAEHQKHTFDLLNSEWKPMILYVLNSVALGIDDDSTLLDKVAAIMKSGDRQSHDRFLFVLNKADEFDPGRGESVARKIDDAVRYLKDHGIPNPRVMPTSAHLAKLIRQRRNGDSITEDEEGFLLIKSKRFVVDPLKHFSDYAHFLSPATGTALKERIAKAQKENDQEELALLYSGVPSIEMAISEYLVKYAVPDKIARGVATFKGKIDSLKIEAAVMAQIETDEKKMKELEAAIQRLIAVLARGDMAKEVKTRVANLSIDEDLKRRQGEVATKLATSVSAVIGGSKETMRMHEAKDSIKKLSNRIVQLQAQFASDIEKGLHDSLCSFADACVSQYNQYIKDIMGEAHFQFPSDVILPRDFDMSGDIPNGEKYRVVKYENTGRTRTVKRESQSDFLGGASIRGGIARFFGMDSFLGKPAYVYVDEPVYENREYFHFKKYLEEKVVPKIEAFAMSTRKMSTEHAKTEAESFKNRFLAYLEGLDKAIKRKTGELQDALNDESKRRNALEENRKNLAWLTKFKSEFDCLLAV